MHVWLGLALLLVASLALAPLAQFLTLRKLRLQRQNWQPHARAVLPKHTLALFDIAAAQLRQQGFEPVGVLAARPQLAHDPRREVFRELYFHAEEGVLAHIEQAPPLTGSVVKILYCSYFADRSAVWTINREAHCTLPLPEVVELHDALAPNWEQQWQSHLARVAAHPKADERVRSKARILHFDEAQRDELIDHWLAQGVLLPAARGAAAADARDAQYRLGARAAWALLRRMARPGSAVLRALGQPFAPFKAPERGVEMMAEHDTAAFVLALQHAGTDPWVKTSLFVASAVAAALVFGVGFGAQAALALMAVLLLHEAGHALAMLATGYRNVAVFFLPGLGAIARGDKLAAKPWQEALVLLAGPLPGIALALALLFGVDAAALSPWLAEWLRLFVLFALVVNLFNLLPFSMLDGGQLFSLAVLSRLPVGKALFAAAGSALLLALALWLRDWPLALLALLLLAGVPTGLRAARLVAAVRAKAEERAGGTDKLSAAQWLRGIYKTFAGKDYAKLGWQTRQRLAVLVLPRLTQPLPSWPLAAALLALHAAALLLPLVALVLALRAQVDVPLWSGLRLQQAAAAPASDAERAWRAQAKAVWDQFETGYLRSASNEERWTLLEQAESSGELDAVLDDERRAWLRRQRALVAESFALNDPRRIDVLLAEALGRPAGAAREAPLREALELLSDRGQLSISTVDAARLPQWIEARIGLLRHGAPAQRAELATLARGEWQALRSAGGKRALLGVPLAQALAELALAQSAWSEAEVLLREAIEVDAQPLSAEAVEAGYSAERLQRRRDANERRLAWLWIQAGRSDDAIAAADKRLQRPVPAPAPRQPGQDVQAQRAQLLEFQRQQQWRQVVVWAQQRAGRLPQAWAAWQSFEDLQRASLARVGAGLPWPLRWLVAAEGPALADWARLDRMALLGATDAAAARREYRLLARRGDAETLARLVGIGVDFDGDPGLAWQRPRIEQQRLALAQWAAPAALRS